MRILQTYSHLNGLEFLEARKPAILGEIFSVIESVDAASCRTKESKERAKLGRLLYSPSAMNGAMKAGFAACDQGWESVRTDYWVCEDAATNRRIIDLERDAQETEIVRAGFVPIPSYNQTDFVRDRVAVEVQFGKYAFVAYDLFVKHLAFYVANKIDVGIEILPMKCLQEEMSSGPSYYEKEIYNLVREGRGVPGVPLVVVGVAP
ncbi:MAG: BglII/BstYI family type II restriction endonuclease [Caulobacter sp.]|nr:BglII/BstYI family type II restriction endonuclease [Caulobacter sp.]